MRERSHFERFRRGIIAFIVCLAICVSFPLLFGPVAGAQEVLPVSDIYIVTTGDTLWNISAQFLGDAALWPALWQINPHIKDPHWIFPGEIVNLRKISLSTHGLTSVPAPEEGKPEVKVVTTEPAAKEAAPAKTPSWGISGLEKQGPVFAATQDKIDSCSFLIPQKEFHDRKRYEGWGTIVDSKEKKVSLSYLDNVFINQGKDRVVTGQVFTIFRVGRNLDGNKWLKDPYYMIKILGKAQAVEVLDGISVARIIKSYAEINVGDMIKPYEFMPRPLVSPPRMKEIEGEIIETEGQKVALSHFDIVFLNLGKADGIEPGNPFEIYRFDAIKAGPKKKDVKQVIRPLGEILILRREERTATAIITKSVLPIIEGDRIRVLQN